MSCFFFKSLRLRDFARLLKVQFTSNEEMSNDAPIHECESEIDHYTGHYVAYSLRRACGFFNVPQIYYMCKGLWEGTYKVYRPYPRRLESQTVCKCYYEGSSFSSVIGFGNLDLDFPKKKHP